MAAKQSSAPQSLQNHFFCQMCRSPLEITGVEGLDRTPGTEQTRGPGKKIPRISNEKCCALLDFLEGLMTDPNQRYSSVAETELYKGLFS